MTKIVWFIVNFYAQTSALHWEYFPVTTDSDLPRVTKLR